MPKKVPWFRFNVTAYNDPAVRLAGCGAVWPWLMAQAKLNGNKLSEAARHPRLAAMDLNIPVDLAREQIDGAIEQGLLIVDENGDASIRNWARYQPDSRPHSSQRKQAPTVPREQPRDSPGITPGLPGSNPGSPGELPGSPGVDGDGDGDGDNNTSSPHAPAVRFDGAVEKYTFEYVLAQLTERWRNERWFTPNHSKFAAEIANYPKWVLDAAFKDEASIAALQRPFGFKRVCERAAAKGRPATPESRAEAFLAQAQADPEMLDALIGDFIGANERPPDHLLGAMIERLEATGREVPEVFDS